LRDIKPPNSAGCLRSALLCQLDPADHRPPPHEQCGTRAVRTSTWRPRPLSLRSLWKGSVNTRTFGRWLARVIEMRTGQRPWADMQMQQIMMAVGVHQRTSQFVVRFLSRALSSLPLFFLSFSLPRAPPPLSHYLSLSRARVLSHKPPHALRLQVLGRRGPGGGQEKRTPPPAAGQGAAWHPAEEPVRSGNASTFATVTVKASYSQSPLG